MDSIDTIRFVGDFSALIAVIVAAEAVFTFVALNAKEFEALAET